jgi:hypothetical protein
MLTSFVLWGFRGLAPHENCYNIYFKNYTFDCNIMLESQQFVSFLEFKNKRNLLFTNRCALDVLLTSHYRAA